MASDLGSFNEEAQRARVAAGFKGGPFNSNPVVAPARTFVNGHPPTVMQKLGMQDYKTGTPIDTWNERRKSE